MKADNIDAAVLECLWHVAKSPSPPFAGASDFLLRLMDSEIFSVDEMDLITTKVTLIIAGIVDRGRISLERDYQPAAHETFADKRSTVLN